ncbi:hypothetical protein NOR51B_565 [Luminiphilus syltensis NOR5-1B]|uniref:Uncharacterized protein n=1 Tax=Luminiphilus syltensis NOR5-1B TaxID=565045 RepID=B8KVK3_9GAMM|nr:hypothetical protein NOR51B_565 [Luminiphilus syltensis NOR5-1B]
MAAPASLIYFRHIRLVFDPLAEGLDALTRAPFVELD